MTLLWLIPLALLVVRFLVRRQPVRLALDLQPELAMIQNPVPKVVPAISKTNDMNEAELDALFGYAGEQLVPALAPMNAVQISDDLSDDDDSDAPNRFSSSVETSVEVTIDCEHILPMREVHSLLRSLGFRASSSNGKLVDYHWYAVPNVEETLLFQIYMMIPDNYTVDISVDDVGIIADIEPVIVRLLHLVEAVRKQFSGTIMIGDKTASSAKIDKLVRRTHAALKKAGMLEPTYKSGTVLDTEAEALPELAFELQQLPGSALELDSSRWNDLIHSYGSAESIPPVLGSFTPSTPTENPTRFWDSFWNALRHQGDLFIATWAVYPWIEQLASKATGKNRLLYAMFLSTDLGYLAEYRMPEDIRTWARQAIGRTSGWSSALLRELEGEDLMLC
jgi:hypothetical protein